MEADRPGKFLSFQQREREYSTVIVAYFRLPTDFAHMPVHPYVIAAFVITIALTFGSCADPPPLLLVPLPPTAGKFLSQCATQKQDIFVGTGSVTNFDFV